MTIIEQLHVETVAAFIQDGSKQSELDHTDQFFTGQLAAAFTDRQYAVEAIFIQGEKVIARIVITAVHTQSFTGIAPTGKTVKITQFREFHVASGQIVSHHGWFDTGTLLPQLQAG